MGWDEGQLEWELKRNTWVMLRAERHVLDSVWQLGERPGYDTWGDMMKRLGPEYEAMAKLPPDAGE